MKIAGYTVGQMVVIGSIALVFIYFAKTLNNKTNIPGLHSIIEGS